MTLIKGKTDIQTNKHNNGYNPKFIRPEMYVYDNKCAIKLFLDCCLRAHYDEYKDAIKGASMKKRNGFVEIHFMKIYATQKTGVAIPQ